ncbi:MAG: toxin-antitoxin system HicB family antitoxin [Sphingobacteriia bacterium]|nr:toxin-antitoxin system HicB family antitoxin [Sphingobacteriia bacterium]NCC41484.1 toxin-antitoxin system HicB family antitoxin [Gammaproteobacteria bacterium]
MPDETYRRLDEIARLRGTSIDRLFDDMAALMVAESDAEGRFRARRLRGHGKAERGLGLLSKAAGQRGEDSDPTWDLSRANTDR